MNLVILSLYYYAANVFFRGAFGATIETVVAGANSPWYLPSNDILLQHRRPEICYGSNSVPAGVCIPWSECINDKHGIPTDIICTNKRSICCVYNKYDCRNWIVGDSMYINSPGFPKSFYDLGYCEINLFKKIPKLVLRLDFIDFSMAMPNKDTGYCETDRLVITNGPNTELVLCGPNVQHIYYRMDSSEKVVNIKFITTEMNHPRTWKIKITLWPSKMIPVGCTQYFNDSSGTFQNTDYKTNGRQLVNKNFRVCINHHPNMCLISYESCISSTRQLVQPITATDKLIKVDDEQYLFFFGQRIRPYLTAHMGKCTRYEQQSCKPKT